METAMNEFFKKQVLDCRDRQKQLQEENRKDEANFEKIKENVYDIFMTVLSAALKQHGTDIKKAREFFMERLTQIPANWTTAYEKAAEYQDVEKMHIESVKLDAVSHIRETVLAIWRE